MRHKSLLFLLFAFLLVRCTACTFVQDSYSNKVPLIDGAGLAQFIQQHSGKVILVDFWATWCPPCLKLFPHTVELHQRLADRGLVVVSISLDDPSDDSAVQRFLIEKGADFPSFISRFGASATSAEVFNIEGGGIPYLRLYNRQGEPLRSFGGDKPFDPLEIDQAVEEALNSG